MTAASKFAVVFFVCMTATGGSAYAQACRLASGEPTTWSVAPGDLHRFATEVSVAPSFDMAPCATLEVFHCLPAIGAVHESAEQMLNGSGDYRVSAALRAPEEDGSYTVMTVCLVALCEGGSVVADFHTTTAVVGNPDDPDAVVGVLAPVDDNGNLVRLAADCLSARVEGKSVYYTGVSGIEGGACACRGAAAPIDVLPLTFVFLGLLVRRRPGSRASPQQGTRE